MTDIVAKYNTGIQRNLLRLKQLREDVWLEKASKKEILSEMDAMIDSITYNNDRRNEEVEEMKKKLRRR